MKRWILKSVFLAMAVMVTAGSVYGQGSESFIESLKKSLDRLFYAEQYVLDVQVTGFNSTPGQASALPGLSGVDAGNATMLPGLNIGDQNYNYNVLLVLDSSISAERVKIAKEVLTRQVESRGMIDKVAFAIKQEKILKTLPEELQATTRQIVSGNNQGKEGAQSSPQVGQQNPEQAKPNIYEFIENKRDLAIRALVVLWTAMASLIALYIIVQRMFGGRQVVENRGQGNGSLADAPAAGAAAPAASAAGPKALTKDEIYSKDKALFQRIQDIVEQARQEPAKVARVIERWVQTSDENSRYASIFLKNCDIKTIENVCKNLHPADIQRVVSVEIDDFDPFSEENRRVLDEVRAEIAMMAATHAVKVKPDVFDFLKSVSDEDLAGILAGESVDDIALIATQIPVHRMSSYIAGLDLDNMHLLMSKISAIRSPSLEEIAPLRARIEMKTGNLGDVLVTKASRVQTLTQMLSNVSLAHRQEEAAANLKAQYPEIYQQVRKGVTLVHDLEHLPTRASKVFLQAIDGEVLGIALSQVKGTFTSLRSNMPQAVREVFEDFVTREHDNDSMSRAWKKIQDELRELISSGLMSGQELLLAKGHAEDRILGKSDESDSNDIGEVTVSGAA